MGLGEGFWWVRKQKNLQGQASDVVQDRGQKGPEEVSNVFSLHPELSGISSQNSSTQAPLSVRVAEPADMLARNCLQAKILREHAFLVGGQRPSRGKRTNNKNKGATAKNHLRATIGHVRTNLLEAHHNTPKITAQTRVKGIGSPSCCRETEPKTNPSLFSISWCGCLEGISNFWWRMHSQVRFFLKNFCPNLSHKGDGRENKSHAGR